MGKGAARVPKPAMPSALLYGLYTPGWKAAAAVDPPVAIVFGITDADRTALDT